MKILLVEDSRKLTKSITTGLNQLGFIVESAEDGKVGLGYALAYDYDLIILDIMLPSIGGIEIIRRLRVKGNKSSILVLSAMDHVDDRVKALNLGADDYLCKPFAFDELLARINTLIRRSNNIASKILTMGKVSIDLLLRQLYVDLEPLDLTPYEYSIVEQLALNRGRVLTYDQLIDHVYSCNIEVSKNSLEAHMSVARKKLKFAGIENLIQTRRSVGYYIDN